MEITANFWKAKFLNPNDETHFDFLIGWIPRAHTECPASLLNNWAQATWALRVRPGDSSDQKIEIGFIIRDLKLSFLEICSNFHDLVATPIKRWSKPEQIIFVNEFAYGTSLHKNLVAANLMEGIEKVLEV